ncbi:MAG: T9SS type A sorting domain-containing protein [Bacteroidia bacterium]|jgi:hypothetical protein|nr:T9SS type A sorting domain-containing protein [Bacteroidia bacterium]
MIKKLLLSITVVVLLAGMNEAAAQTTLINPAGDGGFESGNTLAANNWLDAQNGGGAANKWFVGTAVVNSGTRSAYISNNGGTNHQYNNGQSRTQHFYRDVVFPAGQPYITLSFSWMGVGESCCDYMEVFLVPTTTTPSAGTELTTGQLGSTYNMQSTWQNVSFSLPCSGIAGTTQRLVFSFNCDGSLGSQPPSAVDNISLVSSATGPACSSLMGTGFTTIASLPYSSGAGTTCGAVNDISSTTAVACGSSFYMGSEDRVWAFTPSSSGLVNIALNASTFSAGLYLYAGCPGICSGGTCVASDDGSNVGVSACVTAGTTYYVVVDGSGCYSYNDLTISAPATTCVAALGTGVVNISLPYSSTGRTTCGKIDDIKSTNVSAVCGSSSYYTGEDEVLYFTAASSGQVTLNLTSSGSYTGVMIYDGCPINIAPCISSTATCVANAQSSTGNKSLCFTVTSGVTYYIVIDSYASPTCNPYDISISAPIGTPSGTVCSNAPAITLPYTATGHTTACYGNDYTNSSTGSCGTFYESGEDRVYAITVSSSACLSITLSNASTTSIGFQVYNGCPGNAGTSCVGSAGGSNPLSASITVPSAGTYYLVVDTWASPSSATYDINVVNNGSGPANDLPCNAQTIPLNVNLSGDNTCSGSSSEPGAATCWTSGTINSVWYSVVCPASGQLRIRTGLGSLANTQIALYSGTCGSLTQVACNDNAPSCGTSSYSNSEITATGLTAGATYFIRVDGTASLTGTFDIMVVDGSVGFPAAVGQDCSAPNPVCNASIAIGNPGYQAYGNICDFTGASICLASGERGSAWYSIPINANGVLEFNIVPNDWAGAPSTAATDYDFAVWKIAGSGATNCAGISSGAVPVRCNYSGLGVTGLNSTTTNNAPAAYPGFNSAYEQQLAVNNGDVYLLCVSNFSNSTSGFTLTFSASAPVNYTAAGNSVTWTGGTNSAWVPTGNWGGCNSPTCGIDAVISPSSVTQPILTAGTYNVRNLTINPGATLTLQAGATLNICGDFTNFGSLVASPLSNIVFNNGAVLQNITGSFIGADKMGNLTITKTGGQVNLNAAIDVGGNLTISNTTSILNTNGNYIRVAGNFSNSNGSTTFTNVGTTGTLEFNGTGAQTYNQGSSTLTLNHVLMNHTGTGVTLSTNMVLGTSGILTLTNGRIVTGANEVRVTNTAVASCTAGNTGSFVAGNLRRSLSGAAAAYNLPVGTVAQGYQRALISFTTTTTIPQLVARFDAWSPLPNGPAANECPNATYNALPALNNGYWTINASANATSGNYDVTLFSTGYSNTAGASGWTVMKAVNISSAWGLQGTCVTTSTAAQTGRTGLNGFSVFAVAQSQTPLPVELISFTGTSENDHHVLRWTTATEQNNDYFILERSTDGLYFHPIATIDGAGNSTQPIHYVQIDAFPKRGENYYRLRQVDFNGAVSYSNIVLVNYLPGNVFVDGLHPNPTSGDIIFDFVSPESNTIHITVTDIAGRIVHRETRQTDGGRMQISTKLEGCGTGVYLLKVEDERSGYSYTARLVHE